MTGKLTWKQFVEFWSARGLKPSEAAKVIFDNWYTKNYTVSYGNIWKDPNNRKVFKSYVEYVYWYMERNNLRWKEALLQLAANQDDTTLTMLMECNVPRAFTWKEIRGKGMKFKWTIKPKNFAKLVGQWRQEFFDRGWLDNSERPEIQSEKSLRRSKLLKKKRKTRR